MPATCDGPSSPLFSPLPFTGNSTFKQIGQKKDVSQVMRDHSVHAARGDCTCWGIPLQIKKPALALDKPVTIRMKEPVKTPWLIFAHTTDFAPQEFDAYELRKNSTGFMRLGENVGDYVFTYADGTEVRENLRWRHQISMFWRSWGQNCFQAVAQHKPFPIRSVSDQPRGGIPWGNTQYKVCQPDILPWVWWLWAWENPRPDKKLVALRIEPKLAPIVLAAVTAGRTQSQPFRWERRQKALLRLPKGTTFDPNLAENGVSPHIQLDLGQVISVLPRRKYPNAAWARSQANATPETAADEVLVEYAAHSEARFHTETGKAIPVRQLNETGQVNRLTVIPPANRRVGLRVVDKSSGLPVPVKLHVHGSFDEYLVPVNRHREPVIHWFEDYSADCLVDGTHWTTYIDGDTTIDLPEGKVYIEVTKGFEIKPVRKVLTVTPRTREVTLTVDKVLPWRERGWVTADTHVHFLSPATAHLEGSAEGVNVVNLLASQWGELMTNVGDFDGKTTFGSREAGGDGEFLVRVGTENRQHVLGHISLLGYDGNMIAPMTTGGPDESALGDPVENLLLEWAEQCRKQNGVVVFPHFPEPRAEHAAALIKGAADAIEFASASFNLGGINPYSICDWYRYLNCGYFYPAVGGTDKMSAGMRLGAIRTYAHIAQDRPFTYDTWKAAIREGNTFVTFGPLVEFSVDGHVPGKPIKMSASGGKVDVTWKVASVTVPMSRVDLIVNGEIRETSRVNAHNGEGNWTVSIDRSSWLALLVRGHHKDQPELIAAHTSPVMVSVEGSPFFSAADAVTILDQIEGALAYLDTLAIRPDAKSYKRMRLLLTSAYRTLHNRMHENGHGHKHTAVSDHPEHH